MAADDRPHRPGPARARARTPAPKRGGRRPGENRPAANRRVAARRRQRQRRQRLVSLAAVGVVVVVVAVLVVVKLTGGSAAAPKASAAVQGQAVPAALYRQLTAAPVSDLAEAARHYSSSTLHRFPTVVDGPPLTTRGKPEVLYMGAEYCPYCATERWPLVLALSKFGTFTGLHFLHSDNEPTEEYRRIPTFSFYKSTYTSPYLTFTPVEQQTVSGAPLQAPTTEEENLLVKYDPSGIPFVYFNGKAVIAGAEYDPSLLESKSWKQVVTDVAGGTSTLADDVDADAGAIVSDLCRVTGGAPRDVCASFPRPITTPS